MPWSFNTTLVVLTLVCANAVKIGISTNFDYRSDNVERGAFSLAIDCGLHSFIGCHTRDWQIMANLISPDHPLLSSFQRFKLKLQSSHQGPISEAGIRQCSKMAD